MGDWIPLMDYAARTGISLSTLRRYIKSDKIPHRIENGRYLLLFQDGSAAEQEAEGPAARHRSVARSGGTPIGVASRLPVTGGEPPALSDGQAQVQEQLLAQLQSKVRKMALELQKAQEEIAELKTLIAFYEETLSAGAGSASGSGAVRSGSNSPLRL